MNQTEKYSIKMKYNQFGHLVSSNFMDETEKILIDIFEEKIISLKEEKKEKYTMLELGSNFSYYSMLFKKILQDKETINLMVDPYKPFFENGKEHFEINEMEGTFINKCIFNPNLWCNINFECPSTEIDTLMIDYNIDYLDVLHMDIDGTELLALESAIKSLKEKKINYIFISTHSENLHNDCKNKLLGLNYYCILDNPTNNVGGDSLLVFTKN